MKISRPFKGIIRPFTTHKDYSLDGSYYQEDSRNSANMMETVRAYNILEKDIISLFEYIEPREANFQTFSYRIYELFLRVCTEFESNAKNILFENGYAKNKDLNIKDYYKLNIASRLSEYKVGINSFDANKIELIPFNEWNNGTHVLTWYQDYNKVKHHRYTEFHRANFGNLLKAMAGLYSIIFSQFYTFTFSKYIPVAYSEYRKDTHEIGSKDNLFTIILPQSWEESEMYEFNWEELKKEPEPFQKFNFNN